MQYFFRAPLLGLLTGTKEDSPFSPNFAGSPCGDLKSDTLIPFPSRYLLARNEPDSRIQEGHIT